MPVEVEVHTVPQFKAPVNSKVGPRQLECDGSFMYTGKKKDWDTWVFRLNNSWTQCAQSGSDLQHLYHWQNICF